MGNANSRNFGPFIKRELKFNEIRQKIQGLLGHTVNHWTMPRDFMSRINDALSQSKEVQNVISGLNEHYKPYLLQDMQTSKAAYEALKHDVEELINTEILDYLIQLNDEYTNLVTNALNHEKPIPWLYLYDIAQEALYVIAQSLGKEDNCPPILDDETAKMYIDLHTKEGLECDATRKEF